MDKQHYHVHLQDSDVEIVDDPQLGQSDTPRTTAEVGVLDQHVQHFNVDPEKEQVEIKQERL